MKRLYMSLGKAYPQGYRGSVAKLLRYSASETPALAWLGKVLLANLIFIIIAIVALRFIGMLPGNMIVILATLGIGSAIVQTTGYMLPYYAGGRRAKAIEAVLPSFYQLMASYLRSGMTPFQALKSASKKEFGLLKAEIDAATSRALGTQSFTDALLAITDRVKSDSLKRSTELMVRGMDSGGSLASLLEESAANLVESRSMRREIIAASRTYTLMIIFAVVVGAPLLLSISTTFNERLIDLTADIGEGVANIKGLESGILMGNIAINPEHLLMISAITIAVTAFISSLLVGIITEGSERYGLKYAVIFVPLSLFLFGVFLSVLGTLF